jgi:hypothetical protein
MLQCAVTRKESSISTEVKATCDAVTQVMSVDLIIVFEASTQTESRYVMTTERSKQLLKCAYFGMLLFQADICVSI